MRVPVPQTNRDQLVHAVPLHLDIGNDPWKSAECFRGYKAAGHTGPLDLIESLRQTAQSKAEAELLKDNNAEKFVWYRHELELWDLIKGLYNVRCKVEPVAMPDPLNEFSLSDEIESYLYATNQEVNENHIVFEWLKTVHTDFFEITQPRANGWVYTREKLTLQQSMFVGSSNLHSNLVSHLDPDAPSREKATIDPQDQKFELELCKALFSLIRTGRFYEACDKARLHGQSWRSALISGSQSVQLYRSPSDPTYVSVYGNIRTSLWRHTCYMLAASPSDCLNEFERAIYGALSGDVSSVEPVCRTYADILWAMYNALLQSQIMTFIESNCKSLIPHDASLFSRTPPTPIAHNREAIFQRLTDLEAQGFLTERLDIAHLIKTHIILDRIDDLFDYFATRIMRYRQGDTQELVKIKPYIFRFLTDFILVLRQLKVNVSEEKTAIIIQLYVEILILANHKALVPTYVSHLPKQMCIEGYSQFLSTLTCEKEREEQKQEALNNDIPLLECLQQTSEMAFSQYVQVRGYPKLPIKIEKSQKRPSPQEEVIEQNLISALMWLVSDKEDWQLLMMKLMAKYYRFLLLEGNIGFAIRLDLKFSSAADWANNFLQKEIDIDSKRLVTEFINHVTIIRFISKLEQLSQSNAEQKFTVMQLHDQIVNFLSQNAYSPEEFGYTDSDSEIYKTLQVLRDGYLSHILCKLAQVCISAGKSEDCLLLSTIAAQSSLGLHTSLKSSDKLDVFLDTMVQARVACGGKF